MKLLFKEYLNIVMYTICGILLIFASYNILLNHNHAKFLRQNAAVSDKDSGYQIYKENVLKLETKLSHMNTNNKEYLALKNTVSLMKKDGVYFLMPGSKLNYYDLYVLNNYFIDTLINEGWISSLKQVNTFNTNIYNSYINILVNNSDYINKEILNNSNYHYDVKNNEIRKTIDEEYKAILNNYKNFSILILELCDSVGGKNA